MVVNQVGSNKQRCLTNNLVKTILNDKFFATDWQNSLFELKKSNISNLSIPENQDLLKAKLINYFQQKSELEYYDYNLFIKSQKFTKLNLASAVKNAEIRLFNFGLKVTYSNE